MQAPVHVLQTNAKRESGRKAQLNNIMAGKAVADIVRTTLGPRAMLKMLLDANGSIVLTNDGNAILREIDVSHPAAKSIIDLSRTQDQEVGDGTTSVIVLAGEMLSVAEEFLQRNIHPTVIIRGYLKALKDAEGILSSELSEPVDVEDRAQLMQIVTSCIGTKFTQRFGDLISGLAIDAVQCVMTRLPNGTAEIDVKKYAKVEKIPGLDIEDSRVLDGVMFEKDVVVPARMRRKIERPRILLMDCPLEYKKGENQTNVELSREEDFAALLQAEEDWIKKTCDRIASFKPDLVVTEKGLSDLAAHYLTKAGISAIRRLRKTDNNRIARACGATIVNRPDEIREEDIGTGAGLFEVSKIGDEFYTFITGCKEPKACSVILRGPSKDVLNEVERNLHDALGVARNVMIDPRLVPGGGAVEMAISRRLAARANEGAVEGAEVGPYKAVGQALEVIPRTLAQNCGANVIRTLTKLRAEHAKGNATVGVDGTNGQVVDMRELGVWDPYAVRLQTINTAVECACLLLRIDDILSGLKKKDKLGGGPAQTPQVDDGANVDSEYALGE